MARPNLSIDSFLRHVFQPKKHAKPVGLRKTTLKGLQGGRKKARLNAFNKMDAVKQQVLDSMGLRESYLRGEVTFTHAKQQLRSKAVQRNLVKPLRPRTPSRRQDDAIWSARNHMLRLLPPGRTNVRHVEENTVHMSPQQLTNVLKIPDFEAYRTEADGFKSKWQITYDNGDTASALWYH